MNSIYKINKGIGKSIEFHGLKAQYVWYAAILFVALMLLFVTLYIAGVSNYISLSVAGTLGFAGAQKIFMLSKKYGEHGLTKAIAGRRLPTVLKCYSRKIFQQLKKRPDKEGNIPVNNH